jgi:hypothetical protein
MKVVIFSSPQRKAMLKKLLKELKSMDVTVIDSPETFGKQNFWMRMKQAHELCLTSQHDNYLILGDDICNIDFDRINALHDALSKMKYSINLVNDGRKTCWYGKPNPILNIKGLVHSDYCDCLFMTNRKSLSLFSIEPVPAIWFDRPNKSSGVGYQLTNKMRKAGILMYTAIESLVYHGDHDSVMNYEERKRTPLISK